ncbi:MAG: oligosaccharide flippase family protein [Myxococcales bacterium]|nr:oligosaccharide flippase family protein [Myxococcales bacterium]MCB9630403.1 oligosaccharide flippase family protein [Sandaracinaceae bacterium]
MSERPPAEDERPLEGRAERGAFWVVMGYGGAQLIRLLGNLILTRLLFEEAFGVMALMSTVLQGLELFSDVGIGPSLIQNEREDDAFVNTAWTLQVGRGLCIWGVACALALPFAAFYEEPQLAWLLPIVSATALLAGFNSTKLFTLNRQLDVRRIEISLIVAQVAGLGTMVIWALVDRSVLALVAGALVTTGVRMLLSHTYLPGIRNRLRWERPAAKELVRFGRWIFVSTLLTFLAGQADRLVFGRLVPLDRLGVYYIGVVIATIPSEALSRLSMQIIFPVYARIRERDGNFRAVFESIRTPLMVLAGWAFAGLIAGGPTAVDLLYDDRYLEAGWAVQILAAGGWVLVLGNTYGAALLAADLPRGVAAGSFAKVLAMAGFIPLGFYLGEAQGAGLGFPGAVLGYAVAEAVRYVVCTAACRELELTGVPNDLRLSVVVAVTGGLGALFEAWLRAAEVHVVLRAALIALVVTLAWLPLGLPLLRARLALRRERRALHALHAEAHAHGETGAGTAPAAAQPNPTET